MHEHHHNSVGTQRKPEFINVKLQHIAMYVYKQHTSAAATGTG